MVTNDSTVFHQFILAYNLDILKKVKKPTFENMRSRELIDDTLCTTSISNYTPKCNVPVEESCSDTDTLNLN